MSLIYRIHVTLAMYLFCQTEKSTYSMYLFCQTANMYLKQS